MAASFMRKRLLGLGDPSQSSPSSTPPPPGGSRPTKGRPPPDYNSCSAAPSPASASLLPPYDFDKADWVSLDVLQSMSSLTQQNLFVMDQGGSRSVRAAISFWRMLQGSVIVVCIGIMAAAVGWTMNWIDEKLFVVRYSLSGGDVPFLIRDSARAPEGDPGFGQHALYFLVMVALLGASALLTHFVCPIAAGGGVPEVKTILSGYSTPAFFTKRFIAVKMVGLILASAAGLSVGKEGPLIQISCAMAGLLMKSQAFRYSRVNTTQYLNFLHCACAAGVAATFGSAFGSTLFSVEITSTLFLVEGLPRCLLTAIIVVITYWFLGSDTIFALYTGDTPGFAAFPASADMLLWCLLGLICGVLSTLFVTAVDSAARWRNRITRASLGAGEQRRRRLLIVAAFSLVALPCGYMELLYYREVSNISVGNPHALVDHMFVRYAMGLSWHLVLYTAVKFIAILFSVTQPLPIGLFSPVFLLGGSIGRVFGEIVHYLGRKYEVFNPLLRPWEFALIGAAAFSGGTTKTISTAVIVYELSPEAHMRVPLGAALLISYYITSQFTKGIYDSLIDTGGQPVLSALPPSAYYIEVREVMIPARRMPMLFLGSTHADAARLLNEYKSPAIIPILRSASDPTLLGSILREDLELAVNDFQLRHVDGDGEDVEGEDLEEAKRGGETATNTNTTTSVPLNFMIVKGGRQLAPVMAGSSNSGGGGNSSSIPSSYHDLMDQDTTAASWAERFFGGYISILMDPSPFQVAEATDLRKLEYLFIMLKVDVVFVVHHGRLTGWVTRDRLRTFIGEREKKPLDDCRDVCKGLVDICRGQNEIIFLGDALHETSTMQHSRSSSYQSHFSADGAGGGGETPVRRMGISSLRIK